MHDCASKEARPSRVRPSLPVSGLTRTISPNAAGWMSPESQSPNVFRFAPGRLRVLSSYDRRIRTMSAGANSLASWISHTAFEDIGLSSAPMSTGDIARSASSVSTFCPASMSSLTRPATFGLGDLRGASLWYEAHHVRLLNRAAFAATFSAADTMLRRMSASLEWTPTPWAAAMTSSADIPSAAPQ